MQSFMQKAWISPTVTFVLLSIFSRTDLLKKAPWVSVLRFWALALDLLIFVSLMIAYQAPLALNLQTGWRESMGFCLGCKKCIDFQFLTEKSEFFQIPRLPSKELWDTKIIPFSSQLFVRFGPIDPPPLNTGGMFGAM